MKLHIAVLLAMSVAPAAAVDLTGIPQCDALLQRYEGCSSQLPALQARAAQRELLEGAVSLRASANNPKLRPNLERFCADVFEKMKTQSDIKACMSH